MRDIQSHSSKLTAAWSGMSSGEESTSSSSSEESASDSSSEAEEGSAVGSGAEPEPQDAPADSGDEVWPDTFASGPRDGSRAKDGEEDSWDGDKPGHYADDDLESETAAAVQTRTAVMKERAAKKAASTLSISLSRSWTRRPSGMPDSDGGDVTQSPGPDLEMDATESFTPKCSGREAEAGEPSPRKRSRCLPSCRCCAWLKGRCGVCARRLARCCAPCVRCVQLLAWLWAGFEARCKHLAFGVRCLCCPLFLLIGFFRCCCGSSEEVPRVSSRSKLSGKGSGRSLTRSGSMAAGKSRSLRRAGTLSARFSEGPSHQPKSTLKQRHPRLPQEEQQQAQKKASAREKFRELRKDMTSDAVELDAANHGGTLQHGQSRLQLKSLKSGHGTLAVFWLSLYDFNFRGVCGLYQNHNIEVNMVFIILRLKV